MKRSSAKSTKIKETNLGGFLRTLRIKRGYTNINEYLRKIKLPISDVYYRDVESGRKSIGLDNAGALCRALNADLKAFYFYLLKDLLPQAVVDSLVRPVVDETFVDIAECVGKHERTEDIYRSVVMQHLGGQTQVLEKETVEFFKEHFDLMPILYFIQSASSTSEKQLEEIARQNHIEMPISEVLAQFEKLGLIAIGPHENGEGKHVRRRKAYTTWQDETLHNKCVLAEVQKSLNLPRSQVLFDNLGSFIYQGLSIIDKSNHEQIMKRLLDLITEVRSADKDLLTGESQPFYFSIVVSARPEYGLPSTGKKENKA